MEKDLGLLFDYQKFENNTELQAVIDAVHRRRSVRMLSDDEAEFVAAAGTPEAAMEWRKPWQNKE